MKKQNEKTEKTLGNNNNGNDNNNNGTIKINGVVYSDKTNELEKWFSEFTDEQKSTIESNYGKAKYLVRQIFDAKGNEMSKGQKTLCVFESGKVADKTTLKKLVGAEIATYNGNGSSTTKTNAEKMLTKLESLNFAELSLTDDDLIKVTDCVVAIKDILSNAIKAEKEAAEKEAAALKAIAALIAAGFTAEEAKAVVERQGK